MSNSSMKSIVIGAGRLGSNIAKMLSKENNDVILIDRNREKLGNVVDFTGFLESGDATDLGLLEECGIKDDDNTNIFISDVCCYIYSVPEVYIRLKDSRKMKVVDDRVKCICPFDLSLEDFAEQKRGE